MKVLLNPARAISVTPPATILAVKLAGARAQAVSVRFAGERTRTNSDRPILRRKRCRLTLKAVMVDSQALDELDFTESRVRNPAISTSYRNPDLPKPNQTVLEAQGRVCTGPTQTKPLTEEQAFKVLDTILKSGFSRFLSPRIRFFMYVCLICYRF